MGLDDPLVFLVMILVNDVYCMIDPIQIKSTTKPGRPVTQSIVEVCK